MNDDNNNNNSTIDIIVIIIIIIIIITIIIMLSIKGPLLTSLLVSFYDGGPQIPIQFFFSHDRSFACFFMIFPGHLRKAILAKFVNIGPLIMII